MSWVQGKDRLETEITGQLLGTQTQGKQDPLRTSGKNKHTNHLLHRTERSKEKEGQGFKE